MMAYSIKPYFMLLKEMIANLQQLFTSNPNSTLRAFSSSLVNSLAFLIYLNLKYKLRDPSLGNAFPEVKL